MFLLQPNPIALLLEQQHLTHQQLAAELGLSRTYWSQLFNRRRGLTPQMRQRLLACPRLRALPESVLWERVSP